MTENRRFYIQGVGIADRERKRLYDLKTVDGFISVRDLLNEQDERIKELQQTIDTIAKDYEESHGMDIRNAEWFTAW